jgi:hypothetical protein
MIAGIDFSTKAVDVVLLDEDSDVATWHRFPLAGQDGFERSRDVRASMPPSSFWDDVLAVGIEDPRGYGAGSLYRVQGAILSRIPEGRLVQPWIPSAWRKTVGLPGNCPKPVIRSYVARTIAVGHDDLPNNMPILNGEWTQDACDAYCIALATRTLLQRTEAA